MTYNPQTIERASNITLVRQTVISGPLNVSGYADFLTADGADGVNLGANVSSIRITFAAGFDDSGPVDYIESISEYQSSYWDGLGASTTHYLYIRRNTITGVLTSGSIDLATNSLDYGDIHPDTGVVDGDFSFIIPEMKMYERVSGSWTEVQVVFVGEAVTDGTPEVTDVLTYALRGRYESVGASYAASTKYSFNSYIGTNRVKTFPYFECTTAEEGYAIGDRIWAFRINGPTSWEDPAGLTTGISTNNAAAGIEPKAGGVGVPATFGKWDVGNIVERSF